MKQTTVSPMAPEEVIGFMNIDRTDFAGTSRAEQIRHLKVEGCVVFPPIFAADVIARIKRELVEAEIGDTSSSTQRTRSRTQPH